MRILSLLVVLACLWGCFRPAPPPSNVLRIPLQTALPTLDPAMVADNASIDALQNSFEGLVRIGADNLAHPGLAESWDVSKDGRRYIFHLKRGVLFQNGRALMAADVKRSFERACSPELNSPMAADYLNDIVGVAEFRRGQTPHIVGVEVADPSTVWIRLVGPRPYFLAKLSLPAASIVDVSAIRDHLHIRAVGEAIGTGPFRITRYDDQGLDQAAFEGYHGGKPALVGLRRPVMTDPAAAIAAYRRGEIDVVPQVTRSEFVKLQGAEKAEGRLLPRATLVYLALNVRDLPDRRVRQAIAMAIDREALARDVMLGTVTPGKGILPPGIPGSRPNPHWIAPDIDRARALFHGSRAPLLRLSYPLASPDNERFADQVAAQLRSKLGMRVKLNPLDTATLIQEQNHGRLAAVLSGWFADYLDPQNFLSLLLTTGSPENHWNYSNAEFDQLCRAADGCEDPARRLKLYAQAEDIALQDAVVIPICYWQTACLCSPRVNGLQSNLSGFLPYNSVSIK